MSEDTENFEPISPDNWLDCIEKPQDGYQLDQRSKPKIQVNRRPSTKRRLSSGQTDRSSAEYGEQEEETNVETLNEETERQEIENEQLEDEERQREISDLEEEKLKKRNREILEKQKERLREEKKMREILEKENERLQQEKKEREILEKQAEGLIEEKRNNEILEREMRNEEKHKAMLLNEESAEHKIKPKPPAIALKPLKHVRHGPNAAKIPESPGSPIPDWLDEWTQRQQQKPRPDVSYPQLLRQRSLSKEEPAFVRRARELSQKRAESDAAPSNDFNNNGVSNRNHQNVHILPMADHTNADADEYFSTTKPGGVSGEPEWLGMWIRKQQERSKKDSYPVLLRQRSRAEDVPAFITKANQIASRHAETDNDSNHIIEVECHERDG